MGRPGFGRDAGDKIPPGDNYCMVMKDACKVLILTKMKRCFCNKAEQFQKFNFRFFFKPWNLQSDNPIKRDKLIDKYEEKSQHTLKWYARLQYHRSIAANCITNALSHLPPSLSETCKKAIKERAIDMWERLCWSFDPPNLLSSNNRVKIFLDNRNRFFTCAYTRVTFIFSYR